MFAKIAVLLVISTTIFFRCSVDGALSESFQMEMLAINPDADCRKFTTYSDYKTFCEKQECVVKNQEDCGPVAKIVERGWGKCACCPHCVANKN